MSSGDDADARPDIRALDEATIQRIAAGEVVERPASVVKELVENSLDADASRVSVAVENGGKDGVRVRDDGVGMNEAQLDVAIEEHTTSKIRDSDDLDAGIGTLGFRGEALYTIGAVSRLTVRSKPRDSPDAGAELEVEGGDAGDPRPAGCPAGTTVEVDDLFFNTPARKKFLKTDATEFDHVNTVVTQYALANPDVAVSLEHNGREVFATEGRGSLESTVLSVYGRDVAEAMVEVEWSAETEGDGERESPVASVTGLVSHPETTRSGREYLSTFVNGRYVTAATLRESVLDAYGGQLAPDRYPFAVLFIEVPSGAVDVNVHPRKMEVRFDDESGVKRVVSDAVESALLDHGLIRSTAPRGRSAPDETAVSPEHADGDVVGGAGTSHEGASDVAGRGARTPRAATPVREPDSARSGVDGSEASVGDGAPAESGVSAGDDGPSTDADSDYDPWTVDDIGPSERPGGRGTRDSPDAHDAARTAESGSESPRKLASRSGTEGVAGSSSDDGSRAGVNDRLGSTRQIAIDDEDGDAGQVEDASGDSPARSFPFSASAPTTQRTLDGDEATLDARLDRLPSMRVLGQLYDTYIVAETESGLVLVDQHAADERVNYERLRSEVLGDTATQALADPVTTELTAREAELFASYADALAELGFEAERADDRTVEVRTVPAVFDAALDPGLLRDVLSAFVAEEDEGGRETVDAVADSLLADLACYPSITGNTSLTEGSVVGLLEALDACDNPYACPHGRPVVIEFGRGDIEDRFERDYPGHAGRRREE